MSEYEFKIIERDSELEDYYRIRNEIFVKEQKIFEDSDIDEYDKDAIHIAAVQNSTGKIVGAVRCYNPEGDTWVGGRLSAASGFRNGRVGYNLVRFAVQTVKARGCTKFLAYVQPQNVKFFQRLNWNPVGEIFSHHGKPHQLMEADLDKA